MGGGEAELGHRLPRWEESGAWIKAERGGGRGVGAPGVFFGDGGEWLELCTEAGRNRVWGGMGGSDRDPGFSFSA